MKATPGCCFGRRSWFFEGVFIKKKKKGEKKKKPTTKKQALNGVGNLSDRKETGWFISVLSLLVGARLASSVHR